METGVKKKIRMLSVSSQTTYFHRGEMKVWLHTLMKDKKLPGLKKNI